MKTMVPQILATLPKRNSRYCEELRLRSVHWLHCNTNSMDSAGRQDVAVVDLNFVVNPEYTPSIAHELTNIIAVKHVSCKRNEHIHQPNFAWDSLKLQKTAFREVTSSPIGHTSDARPGESIKRGF